MRRHFLVWVALVFAAQMIWGVDPSVTLTSYYAGIDGKATDSNDALRVQLCTIISNGYTTIGYSSLSGSVYAASSDPSDFYNGSSKTMEDIYSSKAYTSSQDGSSASTCGTGWNKEHTVPQSWFNESSPMKSDAHHVFPTDIKMNSVRSNYPYGENNATKSCSDYGYGHLGTSTFPGYTGTVFDPGTKEDCGGNCYRGDLARVYFYMATRYRTTNFTNGTGGTSFTYTNGVADLTDYMKNLMLKWHREDPVSEKELIRNNAIYAHQKNRNPFVDYPCLVEYIWGEHKGEAVELSALISGYEGEGTDCCSGGGGGSTIDPIPSDYYTPVAGLKDSLLKSKLAELTWTNYTKRYSYGSGKNNTWDAFWYTDRNEADNSVVDMYSDNKRYFDPDNTTASVTDCDIEHMFPNSWFGGESGNKHAYCDLHHLVPADYSANRSKGNYGPGVPTDTTFNNGVWMNGKDANRGNLTVFCPPDEYKGDFARAFFYVATTYGDTAVWQTDNSLPHVTNDDWHEFLPETRNLLLKWHREDPVSEKELIRNNTVYGLQGNRNPFIDYPCLVEYIWGTLQGEEFDLSCSDLPTPKYTITWSVNGVTSSNQVIADLQPTAPSVDDCSTDRVFVGWTTSAVVDSKPEVLYKSSEIPVATDAATYYAVFADKEGEGTGSDYVLFNGTLTEGDYIIYYGGKAMKAEVSSNRFAYSEVSPVNNTISDPAANIVWHIAPSGNYWTIYNEGVKQYAAGTGASNKAQLLASGTDDKSLWTVSDKYDFTNKYNAANSANAILRNNGTYGFACYSSQTGKALSLYKAASTVSYSNYGLLCEECTPEEPNASFASSTKTSTCGGVVSNTLNKGGSAGKVTYTTSNAEVATVEANSGAVSIWKTGTAVITAHISAAGCYTATTASYTLTVNPLEATTTFIDPTTSLEESESALNAASTTSGGTIIYTSNNTEVATVNALTGEVKAVKAGTARITASVAATDCYGESSAYYDLTVTAIPTYTIIWKANGVTVQTDIVKRGAGYSLPDDPENCSEDRVFKGWTVVKDYESETTAPEDLFYMALAAPILTQDTTYYAVYADKKAVSGQVTVTDSLARAFTGITGTSYSDWADKEGTSGAVYAGNSAGGNNAIQMRSTNNSGIITTTSPGTIKNVTLVWNSITNTTRVVNVYGKNTPYESAADLYSDDKQGTLLGSMKKESNTKTSLDISGTYAYIGIRSNSNALYLDSVLVTWIVAGGATQTTYVNYSTRCYEVYDFKALAATDVTNNSFVANWTEAYGDSYTLDVTTEVKKPQETTVFDKDFTASLEGWTIDNVSGYENVWTHSTSYGAYATSYKDKVRNAAESWLLSPSIDLTGFTAPHLTLNHAFRYGTSVFLKVKEESATEWTELSPTNWAAGSDWTFVNSVADLSSYAGKIIRVGFQYVGTTEACPTWEIKRITIKGTTETDDLESIEGYPRQVYDTYALVSGLDPKTTYYYTVTSEDGIISNRIEVTTAESSAPTDTERIFQTPEVRKVLINGQLFILRDSKIYTVQGAVVR